MSLKSNLKELLTDKEVRETVQTFLIETQRKIDNSNKIKFEGFESLNWNKNPAVKETAERLGIFENPPLARELNLNLEDSETVKILEKLDIDTNSIKPIKKIVEGEVKEKTAGKTVYFRDFVEQMADDSDISDFDIIDAEIIEKPIQIKEDY